MSHLSLLILGLHWVIYSSPSLRSSPPRLIECCYLLYIYTASIPAIVMKQKIDMIEVLTGFEEVGSKERHTKEGVVHES